MFDADAYLKARFAGCIRGREDLHEYQRTATDFLHANPFSALFIDVGLGKTVICLTLLTELLERNAFKRVLIIAPKLVAEETWPAEIPAWRHTCYLTYTLLRPTGDEPEIESAIWRADFDAAVDDLNSREREKLKKKYITQAKEQVRLRLVQEDTMIHIISKEQIEWIVDYWGSKWPYDVVIYDESSGLGDHNTVRFNKLKSIRPYMKRFHELTADPAAESYMKLFSQIYLLDRGERFGRYITHFRRIYFDHNSYSRTYKLRPEAKDLIIDKIVDICLVMKAKDYLPRNEPMIIMRPVSLSEKEMDRYKRFQKEFILDLDDDIEIEAETAAALAMKLLQLCSGAVYDNERQTHFVHDHKIEELKELVEEMQGEPLLVSYWFQSSLTRLRKSFPDALIMGKTKNAKSLWNTGKHPVMLIHPQGGAHGLNLQDGGWNLAVFDMFWSYELLHQLIGRIDRQGQLAEYCRVFMIATRGTRDFDVTSRQIEKKDAQEYLFNRIRYIRRKMLEKKRAAIMEAVRQAA